MTNDMYALSEIIDKMDIMVDAEGKTQEQFGAEFLQLALRRIHRARDEVNALLADVTGKTPEEVGKLPIKETFALISELLQQEGVRDFLSSTLQ